MKLATLIFAGIAAVCSAATLGVVVLGAKHVDDEIMKLKVKTGDTLTKFKNALENVEI